MSGFGAKAPSAVEAKGRAVNPDVKQIAADEVNKQAEQARTSHGLPTPESTPGPETARLEADRARQQAEAAMAPSNVVTPESTSGPNTAGVTVDIGKGQAKPSQNAAPPDTSPDGASDQGQKGYTEEQKNAVNRVLKCGPKPKRRKQKSVQEARAALTP